MTRLMVMCQRGAGNDIEAEPIVASLDGGMLTLELDDGDRLVFDLDEILLAQGVEDRAERRDAA